MRTATEAELDQRIRDRAQMYGTAVSSAMLATLIHEGAHELWDLMISARGPEYYQRSTTIATVAGTTTYTLPADFYRMLAVLVNQSPGATMAATRTGWQKCRRAKHHDLAHLLNATGSDPYATSYQLNKADNATSPNLPLDQITLYPVPSGVWTLLVTYVPTLHAMAQDPVVEEGSTTWTYDGVHGWEEYIVLWVVIRLLEREETDTSGHRRDLEAMRARILGLAARDDVEPEYVSDVRNDRWSELAGVRTALRGLP